MHVSVLAKLFVSGLESNSKFSTLYNVYFVNIFSQLVLIFFYLKKMFLTKSSIKFENVKQTCFWRIENCGLIFFKTTKFI